MHRAFLPDDKRPFLKPKHNFNEFEMLRNKRLEAMILSFGLQEGQNQRSS